MLCPLIFLFEANPLAFISFLKRQKNITNKILSHICENNQRLFFFTISCSPTLDHKSVLELIWTDKLGVSPSNAREVGIPLFHTLGMHNPTYWWFVGNVLAS